MPDDRSDVESLVKTLVSALVDKPDDIEITSQTNDGVLLIEVSVAGDDISKVIGRNGRIIKSIRTLTRASAAMSGIDRVDIEVDS